MALPDAVLDPIRALAPILYVRTGDPDATFAELQTLLQRFHKSGFPADEAALATCDPKDEQKFCLLRLDAGREFNREALTTLIKRRTVDVYGVLILVYVGSEPASKVIPDWLQHATFPVDLVDPLHEGEDPLHEGEDNRPRENPVTRAKILVELTNYLKAIPEDPAAPDTAYFPPLGEQLVGLNMLEVRQAMGLSIVTTMRRDKANGTTTDQLAMAFTAEFNDQIRHRWGRLA